MLFLRGEGGLVGLFTKVFPPVVEILQPQYSSHFGGWRGFIYILLLTIQDNPDDLRERWVEYRAAVTQSRLRNRLGSFSGFRRAISENTTGVSGYLKILNVITSIYLSRFGTEPCQTDLLFDQFQDFVNKYFDTNEEFKKRLFEAFDFGRE